MPKTRGKKRARRRKAKAPRYDILTWDTDEQTFTPQPGIRRGPWSRWGLRKAIRMARGAGYDRDSIYVCQRS